jgi:hypothetical protein
MSGEASVLDEKTRWVLRNARQHATEPELRTASGFAGGAGRAPAVHRAQVGRWEGGAAEITHDLVRRYETILGLPEGQLLCAIDYLSRQEHPIRTMPTLVPRGAPDVEETLALLEQALGTARMTSADWDHLSANLSRMPHALIRAADWEKLMRRCILEMTVTGGLDFAQRQEAVARLAGHPRSGRIVVGMAQSMLEDPATAVYTDVAALLRYSTHPGAVPLLLRHIDHPTNNDSLRAAIFALTMMIRAGRLGAAEMSTAARLALGHVRHKGRPFYVHRAAASLLRVLDLPERRRLAVVLSADDRRHVASILMEGRALDPDTIRAVKQRVLTVLDETLRPVDSRDAVLQGLLTMVLGSTEEAARSIALTVLMLSPQGRPVGRAYAAELSRARRAGDDVAVTECLSVLTWLVQPESLEDLTTMLLDSGSSPEQTMLSGICLGNCDELSPRDGPARELATLQRALAIVGASAAAEDGEAVRQRLRGLVYCLGVRGRFDLLQRLHGSVNPAHPHAAVARAVTQWWLDVPEYVRPQTR